MMRLLTKSARKVAILIVLGAAAAPAFAQCSMCRAALSASSEAAAAASGLNLAIIVLLVPPVVIFVGVFVAGYRYRNAYRPAQASRLHALGSLNSAPGTEASRLHDFGEQPYNNNGEAHT